MSDWDYHADYFRCSNTEYRYMKNELNKYKTDFDKVNNLLFCLLSNLGRYAHSEHLIIHVDENHKQWLSDHEESIKLNENMMFMKGYSQSLRDVKEIIDDKIKQEENLENINLIKSICEKIIRLSYKDK